MPSKNTEILEFNKHWKFGLESLIKKVDGY